MKSVWAMALAAVGLAILAVFAIFPLLAQQQTSPSTIESNPIAPGTLYDKLGGATGITAMANDLSTRMLGDSVIMANKSVADALSKYSPQELKDLLVTSVCQISGGPCKLDRSKIKTAPGSRVNIQLSASEWDEGLADLRATLDKFDVPTDVQNQLLLLTVISKPRLVPAKAPQ
jgi:hemoglobin